MTTNEYNKYWLPAAEALGIFDHRLDTLLGVEECFNWCRRTEDKDTHLSKGMKELLIKLAGPHGRTILKAYRIKKCLSPMESR